MLTTRCPACQTLFGVRPAQLRMRGGWVRCGRCDTAFDALVSLDDTLEPGSAEPTAPQAWPPVVPMATTAGAAGDDGTTHGGSGMGADHHAVHPPTDMRQEPATAWPPSQDTAGWPDDAWRSARADRKPASRATNGPWAVLVGVLLGTLVVQAVYVFRVELARQWPGLRPHMVSLCEQFGCDMPLPRQPLAIRIDGTALESEPDMPGRYVLSGSVRNAAAYAQAHPHLELTLTDIRDQALVRRVLTPEEWASVSATDLLAGMAGGADLSLRVAFSTPGLLGATGYRLYAFYP